MEGIVSSFDSKHLKTACLHYFRYKRQFPMVATEAGGNNADVIAIDQDLNRFIEVEVKVSKNDLLADFKKGKHEEYLSTWKHGHEVGLHRWTPQEFYFLVPNHLVPYALNVIDGLPYGLMEYYHHDPRAYGKIYPWGDRISVVAKATRLHKVMPGERVIQTMTKRMSSEICVAYEQMLKGT